jgi:hypothetical protein
MANAFFFLPFYYFFETRVTSVSTRVSRALIYLAPILLTATVVAPGLNWQLFLYLLAGAFAVFSIYEFGDIENDSLRVKSEQTPNFRLNEEQLAYAEKSWWWIVAVRVALSVVAVWVCAEAPGMMWFTLSLLTLMPVFILYNRTRSKWNALIHPLLVTIRFCSPLLLVLPRVETALYGFLLFPLINSLECAAERRYHTMWLQNFRLTNQVSGRWAYYGVLV